MPSLNSSLNLGQRALSINQRAMHTVGHNIANQETEGFSRQQVHSGTSAPDPTGVGGGADAQPATRVYDKFVQRKILQEIRVQECSDHVVNFCKKSKLFSVKWRAMACIMP